MHWEPLDSPYALATKAVYKLLVKVRVFFILLCSSWFMKPSHFRRESDSIYKNLGWGLPLIPGYTYAWGVTTFFGPSIEYHLSSFEETIPHFSTLFLGMFSIGSTILIAAFIYLGAFFAFAFHSIMCGVGKICRMREAPPPYEFFLVRAAGGWMWFSVSVCLMALFVLAQRPDLIGRLAAGALAVPLIWTVLFAIAGLSGKARGTREIVHLKDMYESDRFVKLVSRTQLTLGILALVLTLAGTSFLSRHSNFLVNL